MRRPRSSPRRSNGAPQRWLPDFPRRGALVQFLKTLLILKRIHALPEAGVLIRQQGLLLDQPLKWLPHQFFARLDVAKDLVAQNEEAAVDPDVGAAQGQRCR